MALPKTLFFFLVLLGRIGAQQFQNASVDIDYPGISVSCKGALDETVSCPPFLSTISVYNDILAEDQLDNLCTTACLQSLQNVRENISYQCPDQSNVIEDSGTVYPATYVVDHYIYTFNISCRKDSSTGEYCDILANSTNGTNTIFGSACSDCSLGTLQMELNSPLGYSDEVAGNFSSLTSSCQKTDYPITSPSQYSLNQSAPTNPPSANATTNGTTGGLPTTTSTNTSIPTASACSGNYTIKPNDTCNSISIAQSVSSFSILYYNNLNAYCTDLPPAGTSICLPPHCAVYTVKENQTCIDIINAQTTNITVTQLQAWNMNINRLCNLERINGTQICISHPGGSPPSPPNATAANPTGAVATMTVSAPSNVASNTSNLCGQYYTVQLGDTCSSVSNQMSLSLEDFYALNPEINANCTNLLKGSAYCVEPVITNSSCSGASCISHCRSLLATSDCFGDSSNLTSIPLIAGNYTFNSSSTSPANSSDNGTATSIVFTMLPTASGTVANCAIYKNYQVIDWNISDAASLQSQINNCSFITQKYSVDISDLLQWNPSLNSNNCTLEPGQSYCVLKNASSATTSIEPDSFPDPITTDIAETIPSSDLGSSSTDQNDQTSITSTPSQAIPTSSSSPSSSQGPPGPTQSGITSDCTQYYITGNEDSCQNIETKYNISFDQLYKWNPAIGSSCQTLFVNFAYCVAGPS